MSTLSSVLFTEYRSRVLGLLLLHPERSYYLREIARLTATVPGTLKREMDKLLEVGLLTIQKVGNQNHYQANQECPIYVDLANVLRKTSGLSDVLITALLPLSEKIQSAFVFGSVASGKVNAKSDIDLMFIGGVSYAEVVLLLHPLQEQLGREINPKVYAAKEWSRLVKDNGAFIHDVLSKPKLFIIGDEQQLHTNEASDHPTKSSRNQS
ncbi:nucleotidyltransferase domain-containing protein [Polynucleobacter sp. Tro8-14-1]|jgi:predicted nucleotidyltransferase|uniref:nucleotidyltransferase domain-containing protein n=1 Tax=Polynucleobacter sp. Tro8-14-1 TaxID=1758383 RepID=UPI001C0E132D|nr:nucleotidyltransferase domain-containing protein [Polynucleobacter sp. Tro8-14-1]MBU3563791.1 nucleotidyltransferase domain-containing protein [Polynucleobacter sp. Tro8-14-1]